MVDIGTAKTDRTPGCVTGTPEAVTDKTAENLDFADLSVLAVRFWSLFAIAALARSSQVVMSPTS
jgi:hypothetical protein